MKRIILITTLIFVLQLNLLASTFKGEIKGTIRVNKKPYKAAQVVLITEDMKTLIQTTNSQGYYSFKNLPKGKYLITVTIDNKFFIKYKLIQ